MSGSQPADRQLLGLCLEHFEFLIKAARAKRLTRVVAPGEPKPRPESGYVVIQKECQAAIDRIREHLEASNVRHD